MAKIVTVPYTDTPGDGVIEGRVLLPAINWPQDWRISQSAPNRTRYENLTCAMPGEETVQADWSLVPDVYKGTVVDRALQAPSKKGMNCRITYRVVRRVTDDEDAGWEMQLPSSGSLTWNFPISPYYDDNCARTDIERMIAVLKAAEDNGILDGIRAMMHRITSLNDVK